MAGGRWYLDEGLRVRTRTGRQVSDSLPELAGLVGTITEEEFQRKKKNELLGL